MLAQSSSLPSTSRCFIRHRHSQPGEQAAYAPYARVAAIGAEARCRVCVCVLFSLPYVVGYTALRLYVHSVYCACVLFSLPMWWVMQPCVSMCLVCYRVVLE